MILLYQIKRDKRDKFRPGKNFFGFLKFFSNPLDKCTQLRYNILIKAPKTMSVPRYQIHHSIYLFEMT